MQIRNYFLLVGVLFSFLLTAQHSDFKIQSIRNFNLVQKKGMEVLGGWAFANAVGGALGWSLSKQEEKKAFYQMNFGWACINGGLAGLGYARAKKNETKNYTGTDLLKEHIQLRNTFIFNSGLDLAYVAGGFLFLEKSKTNTSKAKKFKGFGNSIILQGAFLFAFDTLMYFQVSKQGNDIIQISSSENGIGLSYNF